MPFMSWGQSENPVSPDTIQKASGDTTVQRNEQQDPTAKYRKTIQRPPTDTIYLFDREPMYVNVMKITYDSVLYRKGRQTGLQSLDKDRINRIKYNWGRLEILNKKPPKRQERYDWRKVRFLKNKRKASDMHPVKEIEAKAKGSGRGYETPKSLEAKARTILRKKAANVNAQYVLITNKNITTAFGEIPSASLSGIAYSKDKRQEEQSGD